jgi:hypothetical protein
MDFVLDIEAFIFALTRFSHLSFYDSSNMVYELLWDCFVLDNFVGGFDFFLEICEYITRGHVPSSISCLLTCCITTIGFKETSQRRSTHRNWRGGLSVSCSHTDYSIQGYVYKIF